MFWRSTPREIAIVFDGHADARLRAQNDRAWLAWHVAALMRSEKLPRFEVLLIRPDMPGKPRAQSPEEMLAMARIITAIHGGEDRRKLN